MTALDLINKFNKDVWNHSDKMFGDVFDNMFSNMSMNSAMKSFPFYNLPFSTKIPYTLYNHLNAYITIFPDKIGSPAGHLSANPSRQAILKYHP